MAHNSSTTVKGLTDDSEVEITSMNADWVTKPYALDGFAAYGCQLFFSNDTPRGLIRVQYTCDPYASNTDVESWVDKTVINVDGNFTDVLVLDSELAVAAIRFKFERTGGSATLKTYLTRK